MNHAQFSELYEIALEWSYEKYSKKETGYTKEYWLAYKISELTVQKCAGIITSQDVDPAFKNRMAWAIKEHFGVHNENI